MTGYERLWNWFGLSYSCWLTLPRSLMHSMPDDWQRRMADLLEEYDEAWAIPKKDWMDIHVAGKRHGKFCKLPDWTSRQMYRHPCKEVIDSLRSTSP